jgi:hypothetical protein
MWATRVIVLLSWASIVPGMRILSRRNFKQMECANGVLRVRRCIQCPLNVSFETDRQEFIKAKQSAYHSLIAAAEKKSTQNQKEEAKKKKLDAKKVMEEIQCAEAGSSGDGAAFS